MEQSPKTSLRPVGRTDPMSSVYVHTHTHTHTRMHTPSLLELGILSPSSKETLHSSEVSTFWGSPNKWSGTTTPRQ